MGMYVLKAIALAGVIVNVILMLRKQKQLRSNTEIDPEIGLNGEEQWQASYQSSTESM